MSRATVTADQVCSIIASVLPASSTRGPVLPEMRLSDLGVDSFGLMSLVFVLEEQTGIDAMSCLDQFIAAEYVRDVVSVVLNG